ncbi:hypothetical protein WP50_11400 [Lactiplantibacillus plantarum]|nr:hypothetical protein WP50_11400 [Lactiplantibacillus plantarum]
MVPLRTDKSPTCIGITSPTFMNFASLIGSFGNDAGLIGSSTGGDGAGGALNWTFNVSNITVPSGTSYTNTSRRFVSAQGNQVNITGNCRVTTHDYPVILL